MAKGMLEALQAARAMNMAPEMGGEPEVGMETGEEMMNPASSNQKGDLVYISKPLAEGIKKGARVMIDGEVVSVGSKIGIQINGVQEEGAEDMSAESIEEEVG